ncbi:MAG: hypothetical protein MK212_18490, partial [Saprospiraceae bacterium]|nr:hypothetical protein [Saprospiraceae bacterium]
MQQKEQKNKTKGVAFQTMSMFSKFHNNLGSFQEMFYRTWFLFLIVGFVLPFLCGYVDFEVLFGIYYDSSQSYWTAMTKAGLEAVLIQLGILVAGGIALKILINWKFENWSWTIQFFLFAFLAGICIFRTFELSYQTYYSSKANAHEYKQAMEQRHLDNVGAKKAERDTAFAQLYAAQQNKLAGIEEQYATMIAAKTKKWNDKVKEKATKYGQGRISKDYYQNKLNEYNGYINEVEVTQLGIKNAAVDSLNKAYDALLLEAKSRHNQDLDLAKASTQTELSELNRSIEDNAQATQGRNVGLNIISLLLQFGGLLYARAVNKELGIDEEEEGKETAKTPNNSNPNNTKTTSNKTPNIPTQTSDVDPVYQNENKTIQQQGNKAKSLLNSLQQLQQPVDTTVQQYSNITAVQQLDTTVQQVVTTEELPK